MKTTTPPLGNNVASLSFDFEKPGESDSYTAQVKVPVGTGGVGVDTARVTKSGKVQEDDKRTVQWTVTINPNKAYLQSANLTDNLADMLFNDDDAEKLCQKKGSHEYGAKLLADSAHKIKVTFEGDYNGTKEFDELSENNTTTWNFLKSELKGEEGEAVDDEPGAFALQLSYNPKTENSNKVLTINVPENDEGKAVGHTSITVTFYTQFTDPCVYAGNGNATKAENKVTGQITLGQQTTSQHVEAEATVPLNTKMLEKQPPVYDYATNTFTWTVVVNEANLLLKGLKLTDTLPAGLTYEAGSLKVNGSDPSEGSNITASQTGQTLTIHLGDLSAETPLTFETEVTDPKILFGGESDVEIENTIEMVGKAYDDDFEFEPVSSTVTETFTNHGLAKTGTLDKYDEQIDYQVLINPYGVTLTDAALTDTLDEGLRLDPNTVKLCNATVTGVEEGTDEPTATRGDEVTTEWTLTNDPANNSFTVTLPDGAGSYLLTYSADVLDVSQESFDNTIAFVGGGMGGEEVCVTPVEDDMTLSTKGSLALTLKDDSGESFPGVTFSLYLWDETEGRVQLLDQAVTGEEGTLTFTALKSGQSYELVETFPEGYAEKYTVEESLPTGAVLNTSGNLVITPTEGENIAVTLKNTLPEPEPTPTPPPYTPPYNPPTKPTGPSTGTSDGWEDIREEIADAEKGDTITVDMNGETEVPGEIFEEVAGKDVTVEFDMGDVTWTVNGQDVPTNTTFSDLNLGVDMGTSGISVDVINTITGEHGSVQVSLEHDGEFGFVLTLTAPLGKENAGYWANLYHYDEKGETLTFETSAQIDDKGDVSLSMTHASQYAIVIDDKSHQLPFTDLGENQWYEPAVRYAYIHDIMEGTSATTFVPGKSLTRAEAVQVLYNLEGQPTVSESATFPDLVYEWYKPAIAWAEQNSVVDGYEDGTFRPDEPVTREEFAQMLYNYASYKGYDLSAKGDLSAFPDGEQVQEWAEPAMAWANGNALINGHDDGTLDPQGIAIRAQAASILMRFDLNLVKAE